MKHLILTTIAAVLVVGCGESQESAPKPEAKPIERIAGAKAPDISIHDAAAKGDVEAVKQHIAAGTYIDVKDDFWTPLRYAAIDGHKEIAELLIANGADVNTKDDFGGTPLHNALGYIEVAEILIAKGADVNAKYPDGRTLLNYTKGKFADLLRKHGGKTAEELKAEGE